MLKLSTNALGMLIAKYKSVLKNMRLKNFVPLAASCLIFCATPAWAVVAHVVHTDANGNPKGSYTDLQHLQSSATFADGDIITVLDNDSSLYTPLNFGGKNVTIDFQYNTVTIEMNSSGNNRFITTGDDGTVTLINADNAVISGFTPNNGNGGAIEAGTNSTVNIENGVVFENNKANGNGGAIFGMGVIDIGYDNTFKDNSATTSGGAIFGNGAITIGDSNPFEYNSATTSGGAIFGNGTITIGDNSPFTGNTAGDSGGAIFGSGNITIGNVNIFTGNTAGILGGAIYGDGDITIGYGNTFENNTANVGGAIWGGDITVGGDSKFENNKATGDGGAIWASGHLALTADSDDIIFRGNTADGEANAIHMYNNNNDKTLALSAGEGQSILFYDPVKSESANSNLTVTINENTADTGTVLFDTHQSDIYGKTTVHNGTMALTGGATYGADDTAGTSFTLESGATLRNDAGVNAAGGGNKIQAGTINLKSGSTLRFDLTGAVDAGLAGKTTNLTLAGGGVDGNVNIDIWDFQGSEGAQTFNLVTASGDVTDEQNFTLRGEDFRDVRATASLAAVGNTLQITLANSQNGEVTWTGGNTGDADIDNLWNATSQNWEGTIGGNAVDQFLHGDAVVFDAGQSGIRDIKILDSGVLIAQRGGNPGMTVQSGDWTFTGGQIEGGAIHFAGDGSIAFDTRTLEQRITVADGITAGISALDEETLYVNGLSATYGGAIYVGENSTVKIEKGVVFANNEAANYGGAILSLGDIDIGEGNTFANNLSANGDGGAIYSYNYITVGDRNIFNDNSAKVTGGAIYGSGNITIGDRNTFESNSAKFGGAILGLGTIDVGEGNTFESNSAKFGGAILGLGTIDVGEGNTFESNSANEDGGAIWGYIGDITIGGGSTFANNSANNGGAIYGSGNITIGEGNTFESNEANKNGGAILGWGDIDIGDGNTFAYNSATGIGIGNGNGGAIWGHGAITIGGGNTFANNSAIYGGAIYGEGNIDIGGGNIFENNSAFYGGAIYGHGAITIGGGNTFANNRANASGGAIYASANDVSTVINLAAEENETILFTGNTDQSGANSIYFDGANDATISLNVTGAGMVDMQDPMNGASGSFNIDITKTGSGTWKLGGKNNFQAPDGDTGITFTVKEGTLDLYQDADIKIGKGSFTLESGATLISRGGNTITKPEGSGGSGIDIQPGSTLGFDLTGADGNRGTTNLTLKGGGISNTVNIDILAFDSNESTSKAYVLAKADNVDDFTNVSFTVRNEDSAKTRLSGSSLTTDNNNTLVFTTNAQNGVVTWTGGNTGNPDIDNLWNATAKNWEGEISGTSVEQFLHGDAVVFDAGQSGISDIKIQDDGVRIAKRDGNPGMTVQSGDWTFTGGKIEGGEIHFAGSGSIAFDTRALEQRITVADGITARISARDGAALSFNGLSATDNGGAIYGESGSTINIGAGNTFEKNTAIWNGGAIYGGNGSTINIGEDNTFKNNTANYDGGAICGDGDITIDGGNTFANNEATNAGGAIWGMRNIDIGGGNAFTNNSANNSGGAIFANSDLTLTADSGDIIFRGNTANGDANAIHLYNDYNNKTLSLSAVDDKSILFYDPVKSESANSNLTVTINKNTADTGTVLFDTHQSDIYGKTTVYNGTMALTGGAAYGADDTTGTSFTLESGATLRSDAGVNSAGGGNKIQAGTITIAAGSTLSFDLSGADGTNGTTTNLALSGGDILDDVIIDIAGLNGEGVFNLVTTAGNVSGNNSQITLNGEDLEDTRANGLLVTSAFGGNTLQISVNTQNGIVTWTGNAHNDIWDLTSQNWDTTLIDNDTSHKYLLGDAVVFNGAAGGDITINVNGVQIAAQGVNPGMTIEDGDWTFSGGQIRGDGGLLKNGTGTLTLKDANRYTGGTTINEGAVVAGNAKALGEDEVQIADGAFLHLNFNGEFANQLSGGGELNIDDGEITVSTSNTDFFGDTAISSGAALTAKDAKALGEGKVQIADGAFLHLDFNGEFANQLSGGGGLNIGGGNINVSTSSTDFSGDTAISSGATLTAKDVDALGTSGNIENNGVLNLFSSSFAQSTTYTINSYSGTGVVGIQASATSNDPGGQWSDILSFTDETPETVTVHFYFANGSNASYIPDEGLTFAQLTNDGEEDTFKLDGVSELSGAYQLSIKTDDYKEYNLISAFSPSAGKVYSESSAASLGQAVGMHGKQLFNATSQAARAAGKNGQNVPGIYAGFERSDARYQTGSHADVKGNNFALALAWQANDKTAWGVFGQKFVGSYTTTHEVSLSGGNRTINSDGDLRSHDIGLFAEYRPAGEKDNGAGAYYKAVLRAGRSSNDFRSDNYQNTGSKFRSGRNLWGVSLGGGYVKDSGQNRDVEYYGHLIYTNLGSDNVTDSVNQNISFDSSDSMRLLSGARLNFNQNKKTSAYFGAALDYEFSGKADSYINGLKADSADIKGLTGIMELGLRAKQSDTLTIDLGLQGYVGKKRGLVGNLTLSKRF